MSLRTRLALVVAATLFWACGVWLLRGRPAFRSSWLGLSLQMLIGALLLGLFGLWHGDWRGLQLAATSSQAWLWLAYLVLPVSLGVYPAYFWLLRAALPHLKPGSCVIASGSQTGIEGSAHLPAYATTKGAIHTFTKTMAQLLIDRGIRVNCVAPGPVWTPLNPADEGRTPEQVATFGQHSPFGRPAQPEDGAKQHRLAAARAADYPEDLALANLETHAVVHDLCAEPVHHVPDDDDGLRRAQKSISRKKIANIEPNTV